MTLAPSLARRYCRLVRRALERLGDGAAAVGPARDGVVAHVLVKGDAGDDETSTASRNSEVDSMRSKNTMRATAKARAIKPIAVYSKMVRRLSGPTLPA